jgi:8-oxo-dGTP diphosphatase
VLYDITSIIIMNDKVLMVQQYVQRGDIVWNFPGGGMEENETLEQTCIREVREETGYEVQIKKLLFKGKEKFTFLAEVISGELSLDKELIGNEDLVDVKWISLQDYEKFDHYTRPVLELLHHDDHKTIHSTT